MVHEAHRRLSKLPAMNFDEVLEGIEQYERTRQGSVDGTEKSGNVSRLSKLLLGTGVPYQFASSISNCSPEVDRITAD